MRSIPQIRGPTATLARGCMSLMVGHLSLRRQSEACVRCNNCDCTGNKPEAGIQPPEAKQIAFLNETKGVTRANGVQCGVHQHRHQNAAARTIVEPAENNCAAEQACQKGRHDAPRELIAPERNVPDRPDRRNDKRGGSKFGKKRY